MQLFAGLPFLLLGPLLQDDPAPDPDLPAAQSVLARLESATGGAGARARVKSLRFTGSIEIPGMPEDIGNMRTEELYAGARARSTSSASMGGMDMTMTMGTTGEWSWSTDPALGVTIREGAQGAAVERLFAVFRGAPAETLYASSEVVGRAEVDGRACFELRMFPQGGGPDTWFVDAETHTLARYDVALPNPEPGGGLLPMQFHFSDYRPVQGLLVAHTRKQVVGAMTLTYRFDSIEANAEFEEARLAPPAEVLEAYDDPAREKTPAPFDPQAVVIETLKERPFASIRVSVPADQISSQLAIILPEVWGQLSKTGTEIDGPPLSRYHGQVDGKVDIEAGFAVKEAVEAGGRVRASKLPAGRTASTWHVGPYHELTKTYARLEAWLEEQEHAKRGAPWEVYWTDPGIEPDPTKWRTQVFWPIE